MVYRNASGELQVKVIDFGIAKIKNSVIAPSTQIVHLAGKWQYMSPEQLEREKATPRSDIYALAVVAYELITGQLPFHARTHVHLAELQKAGVKLMPQDMRPGDLSDAAQRAILRALSYDPADRPQDVREFSDALARALTENNDGTIATPAAEPVGAGVHELEKQGREKALHDKAEVPRPGQPAARHPLLGGLLRASPTPRRWLIVAGTVFICLLGVLLWYALHTPAPSSVNTTFIPVGEPKPERELNYWFMVSSLQYPGTMKPSLGTATFYTGVKCDFVAKPTQAGWLYLINKGKDGNGNFELVKLFPTPSSSSDGSARLEANQERRIEGIKFTGGRGYEEIYIVWSATPIERLEAILREANDKTNYRLTEAGKTEWQKFLDATPLTQSAEDRDKTLLTLKGRADILVSTRRLEHESPP